MCTKTSSRSELELKSFLCYEQHELETVQLIPFKSIVMQWNLVADFLYSLLGLFFNNTKGKLHPILCIIQSKIAGTSCRLLTYCV